MPSRLEFVAVTLVDLRASADHIKRAVTNAQASIEQYRHHPDPERLADIRSCLDEISAEAAAVAESTSAAREPLQAMELELTQTHGRGRRTRNR